MTTPRENRVREFGLFSYEILILSEKTIQMVIQKPADCGAYAHIFSESDEWVD